MENKQLKLKLSKWQTEYIDFHKDVKNFCSEMFECLGNKFFGDESRIKALKSINDFEKRCIERISKQLKKIEE